METIFHDFSSPMFSFHRNNHWTGDINLHFHIHYELDAIRSGDITVIANGTRINSRGPCILLYKPYCYHVNIDHKTDPYDIFVFHYSKSVAQSLSGFVDVDSLYRSNVTLLPIEDDIKDEYLALLDAYGESPERETERRLLLGCLLDIVKRRYSHSTTDKAVTMDEKLAYIREAADYVSTHFGERLTADELAKQFLVSRQKLDADFKSVMNLTLRQYILDIRTTNAIRLLSLGKKVADVSYECGFSNESHFIHTFKDRMGISPYQYLKSTGRECD